MQTFFNRFFKGDPIIWGILVMLSIVSIIEVYSATGTLAFKFQDGNTSYYILRHSSFILLGFVFIWVTHKIPHKYYTPFAPALLILSIVLLVFTLARGNSINSAARWIAIPFIGLSFQPSELAKLSLIIFAARKLAHYQKEEEGRSPDKAFKPIMGWTLGVCLLIAPEDLSTAVLIGAIIMLMLFIGRVPIKYLLGTAGAGIALIALLILIAPRFDDVGLLHRVNTWRTRIETFSDTENASSDASFQSDQAKIAISRGGLLGKFPGNSRQSNYLPHPYSDFIYAIIVEEGGLLAGSFVIFLYLVLMYRAILTAHRCKQSVSVFLITGLTSALVLQAFAHIFVCVGILPVTGQTLPFVSMGGTSLLLTSISFGMILGITQFDVADNKEKPEGEYEAEDETMIQIEEA